MLGHSLGQIATQIRMVFEDESNEVDGFTYMITLSAQFILLIEGWSEIDIRGRLAQKIFT